MMTNEAKALEAGRSVKTGLTTVPTGTGKPVETGLTTVPPRTGRSVKTGLTVTVPTGNRQVHGDRQPIAVGTLIVPQTSRRELPLLLNVDETATILRTSRMAVYAMAARGQPPGLTRLGRRVLVRSDVLLDWLDQRRAPSPKE